MLVLNRCKHLATALVSWRQILTWKIGENLVSCESLALWDYYSTCSAGSRHHGCTWNLNEWLYTGLSYPPVLHKSLKLTVGYQAGAINIHTTLYEKKDIFKKCFILLEDLNLVDCSMWLCAKNLADFNLTVSLWARWRHMHAKQMYTAHLRMSLVCYLDAFVCMNHFVLELHLCQHLLLALCEGGVCVHCWMKILN